MNEETRLNKVTCPKGHDTLSLEETPDHQAYGWCSTCQVGYPLSELKPIPVDRRGFTPLDRPHVYGKLN